MPRELISIIIPVYNAAKYLEDCVTSVLRSTSEQLEVILFSYAQAWLSFKDAGTRFHYWKGYVRFFLRHPRHASTKGSLLFLLSPHLYCALMRYRQQ